MDVKVQGICHSNLYNTGYCTGKCKFAHVDKNLQYIDSHCHLDLLKRRHDYHIDNSSKLPSIFGGCINNLCFPVDYSLWPFLKSTHYKTWFTVGLHPKYAQLFDVNIQTIMEHNLSHPVCVGVGEFGLDFTKSCSPGTLKKTFIAQLQLAQHYQKPVVLHFRNAYADGLTLVKQYLPHDYIIHLHCFSGTLDDYHLWTYFSNCKLGITNMVTIPEARHIHTLAKQLPMDHILLETDSPYFVPRNIHHPWTFSHPGHALNVAMKIAHLRNTSINEILSYTAYNTQCLYSL